MSPRWVERLLALESFKQLGRGLHEQQGPGGPVGNGVSSLTQGLERGPAGVKRLVPQRGCLC